MEALDRIEDRYKGTLEIEAMEKDQERLANGPTQEQIAVVVDIAVASCLEESDGPTAEQRAAVVRDIASRVRPEDVLETVTLLSQLAAEEDEDAEPCDDRMILSEIARGRTQPGDLITPAQAVELLQIPYQTDGDREFQRAIELIVKQAKAQCHPRSKTPAFSPAM